jgi:hypothetical protein
MRRGRCTVQGLSLTLGAFVLACAPEASEPSAAPSTRFLPPTDLCAGLVQDKAPHPMSPLAPPAAGGSVVDPEFGTRIRRITSAPRSEGANAVIKPMYSTVQAWNADESYLVLWHRGQGHELYDGHTYRRIRNMRLVSPSDLEHVLWDPFDPDVLYYPSNYNAVPNLMRYNVSSDTSVVAKRFEFCPAGDWGRTLGMGSAPRYLSWGERPRIVGLSCGDTKFLYDIGNDQVLGRTTVSTRVTAQPGASGRVAWFYDSYVYDIFFRRLGAVALGDPSSHSSLGLSATGHDFMGSVVFDPPPGGTEAADVGTLVSFDLQDRTRKVVIGLATGYPYPPSTTHVSAIAHRRPGWVAVSAVGDPAGRRVLEQELLLANVDSGKVCRVGHHHSFAREGAWDYWAEPHVVISPSGTACSSAATGATAPRWTATSWSSRAIGRHRRCRARATAGKGLPCRHGSHQSSGSSCS